MNVKNGVEWKNFETGEIIGRMEDTNRLGIKIIEIKYSVKPDVIICHVLTDSCRKLLEKRKFWMEPLISIHFSTCSLITVGNLIGSGRFDRIWNFIDFYFLNPSKESWRT